MNLRKAVFGGSWYPASAHECEAQITSFMEKGLQCHTASHRGGIVPHAGWYFSGSIACNIIHHLSKSAPFDVVAVFGMHLHSRSPRYIMPEGSWETPFGPMVVDTGLAEELIRRHKFQIETTTHYQQDNTIELQMPFIKYFMGNARVVAMGVPPNKETLAVARSVVEIADEQNLTIAVIGSTDLTHYGPNYGMTGHGRGREAVDWVKNENDKRVIDAMLRMDPEAVLQEGLAHDNACCSGAAAAAIHAGKALGAKKAEMLTYASSYDKSPGDSFVGYAGVLF